MEYIVIDLETTGLDSKIDEIIEIGAVKITDGVLGEEYQTFVKPSVKLTFEIANLTSINDDMLADAPDINLAISGFLDFIGDCQTFIAHNKNFEESFLNGLLPFQPNWLDTMDIAKIVKPTQKYFRLSALVNLYSIINENAHRAIADAKATAQLFLCLIADFQKISPKTIQKFMYLTSKVQSPLADLINYYGSKAIKNVALAPIDNNETPIFNGKLLFNNQDKEEADWNYQVSTKNIKEFFDDLCKTKEMDNPWELRPQQLTMAQKVAEAFNNHHALLVEAGTGTGKSLAYLLPAVLYSLGSKMPVTISTNTINLQEQLINKDIPMLQRHFKQDFFAVVVKGRGNYLCRRKWQSDLKEVEADSLALLLRITHWLTFTTSGDYGELNLFGKDYLTFSSFAAHSETCAVTNCPHFKSRCYINNVRKMAAKADLIIINHSLLLATSFLGNSSNNILPPIENLIIDEAHQLEAAAERQLLQSISLKQLDQILAILWRKEKLANLIRMLERLDSGNEYVEDLLQINDSCEEFRNAAQEFFKVGEVLFQHNSNPLNKQIRILKQPETDIWFGIADALKNMIVTGSLLCIKLECLIGRLGSMDDPFFSIDIVGTFNIFLNSCSEYIQTAKIIEKNQKNEYVIWVEKSTYNNIYWYVSPVNIKNALCESLYQDKLSLIMTSATLTNPKFDFFKEEIGLNLCDMNVETFILSSPFDYKENARIFVADDIGDFSKTSELVTIQEITDALFKLITASKGRALILFTSYQQQKNVYKLLAPRLKAEGINVLAHGISGGRDNILEAHKQNPNSCILGVNSFWEGVDIKGEALSLLVMVRLPFMPPNTPIMEAKFERLEAEGKSPFNHYSLPQAIIRFKQGFGRLIRGKEDRGVFCILDQRIWSKFYGKQFLASLPDIPARRINIDAMVSEVKKFLE